MPSRFSGEESSVCPTTTPCSLRLAMLVQPPGAASVSVGVTTSRERGTPVSAISGSSDAAGSGVGRSGRDHRKAEPGGRDSKQLRRKSVSKETSAPNANPSSSRSAPGVYRSANSRYGSICARSVASSVPSDARTSWAISTALTICLRRYAPMVRPRAV